MPFQYTYRSSLLVFVAVVSTFSACNQAAQKAHLEAPLKDTSGSASIEHDSSQTAYICAMRSLRAMEKGNLEALLPFIHPTKGVMINHVGEFIQHHEKPFTVPEIKKEIQEATLFTVVNGYEEEEKRKSSLVSLLKHYSTSRGLPDDTTAIRLFSAAKDVRRNYTGNGTYILVPPLSEGQTTISYHYPDSTNETNWEELVLRTETYQGKDYLVEILRAYWTP